MMPRLKAEESLHEAEVLAVGTGRIKRQESNRLVAGWQRTAHEGTAKTARPSPSQLAGMGLGFKVVTKQDV